MSILHRQPQIGITMVYNPPPPLCSKTQTQTQTHTYTDTRTRVRQATLALRLNLSVIRTNKSVAARRNDVASVIQSASQSITSFLSQFEYNTLVLQIQFTHECYWFVLLFLLLLLLLPWWYMMFCVGFGLCDTLTKHHKFMKKLLEYALGWLIMNGKRFINALLLSLNIIETKAWSSLNQCTAEDDYFIRMNFDSNFTKILVRFLVQVYSSLTML